MRRLDVRLECLEKVAHLHRSDTPVFDPEVAARMHRVSLESAEEAARMKRGPIK